MLRQHGLVQALRAGAYTWIRSGRVRRATWRTRQASAHWVAAAATPRRLVQPGQGAGGAVEVHRAAAARGAFGALCGGV